MKAKTRIHSFLNRKHVIIKDLATRFLADSNLHAIRVIISDTDPDYAQNDEITITKKSGGFLITREIGRWEPFYGTETEVFKPHCTHNTKHVKAIIGDLLNIDAADIDLLNQHGRNANIKIVRFASK